MAKKRGKKRPLVGAAKASHEAKLARGGKKRKTPAEIYAMTGKEWRESYAAKPRAKLKGKKVSAAQKRKIEKEYEGAIEAIKGIRHMSSVDRITKVREAQSRRERRLAGFEDE